YGNDFSHAPTNGIEATFSRNTFANNLILECWHGIWGGYSYESKVIGNVFGYNAEGIAWEHGQDNLVEGNTFHRDHEGLVIWSNPTQDPNWEYPKRRDTKSRDWTIKNNTFGNTFLNALRIRRTEGVTLRQNQYWGVANVLKAEDVSRLTQEGEQENAMPALPPASALNQGDVVNVEDYERRFTGLAADWNPLARNTGTGEREKLSSSLRPKPLEGGMAPFLKPETLRGWRYMIVDEWGPYDFKRPILVPRGEVKPTAAEAGRVPPNARATVRRFEILGPKGTWRVVQKRGIETLSSESGDVPGFIDVTLPPGKASDVNLELEYRGDRVVDDRGVATGKGMPHRFGYTKFFAPIDWRVRFHAWNPERVKDPKAAMPTPGELLSKAELDKPLHELRTDRVDFGWGGSPATGVPADHFITIAEGELEIQQGEYTLNVTTDDGMRVWIDDVMVLESWKYQGPTPYSVNVRLQGKHRIRVEHYEIDGYAALKVELVPRKPIRS
ncbi:MAG TPA: PA14 domain-containing protein, partial [Fimbriimonadaceae bacterium]|nr:PA14 domain-containing protein [Fimbriimonadaceae bacterium]